MVNSAVADVAGDLTDTPHRKFWQEASFRDIARWQYLHGDKTASLETLRTGLDIISKRQVQNWFMLREMKDACKLLKEGKTVGAWEEYKSSGDPGW